jgi:predicted DNA-binding transcriptional regulator AlpA
MPVRLDAKKLRLRLGGVNDATVRRWQASLAFPRPHFLAGRRMWWLHEVEAWEREQMANPRLRRSVVNLRSF